jgi:hypothetical protein
VVRRPARPKAAFLRTPKTGEQTSALRAPRANWAESILAVFGAAGIIAALTRPTQLSGPLLAALSLFPTRGMAAAPFNSWAARRAALPPWLRGRRRTEYRREHSAWSPRARRRLAGTGAGFTRLRPMALGAARLPAGSTCPIDTSQCHL